MCNKLPMRPRLLQTLQRISSWVGKVPWKQHTTLSVTCLHLWVSQEHCGLLWSQSTASADYLLDCSHYCVFPTCCSCAAPHQWRHLWLKLTASAYLCLDFARSRTLPSKRCLPWLLPDYLLMQVLRTYNIIYCITFFCCVSLDIVIVCFAPWGHGTGV